MIVTIGAGITDVAILSLGGIVTAQSVRVAGDAFDEAIIAYLRRRHGLLIGERSAERIKIGIGSVASFEGEQKMEVKGRGTVDGLPKTVTVTARGDPRRPDRAGQPDHRNHPHHAGENTARACGRHH